MKFKRVLLKISGEALMGDGAYGISTPMIRFLAEEIRAIRTLGIDLALVIGAGNIFRGVAGAASGMERGAADNMGMLATVMNSLAVQDGLERHGVPTRVMSAIAMRNVCEPYDRRRACEHLEDNRVVIFAAGTGNPYFTTDTAAVLRALEIRADVIMKATRVDGVYDRDPKKHPDAVRFEDLDHDEVIARDLQVMDTAAFALCRDSDVPLRIYDLSVPGNLMRILRGEHVGTLVKGRG